MQVFGLWESKDLWTKYCGVKLFKTNYYCSCIMERLFLEFPGHAEKDIYCRVLLQTKMSTKALSLKQTYFHLQFLLDYMDLMDYIQRGIFHHDLQNHCMTPIFWINLFVIMLPRLQLPFGKTLDDIQWTRLIWDPEDLKFLITRTDDNS